MALQRRDDILPDSAHATSAQASGVEPNETETVTARRSYTSMDDTATGYEDISKSLTNGETHAVGVCPRPGGCVAHQGCFGAPDRCRTRVSNLRDPDRRKG